MFKEGDLDFSKVENQKALEKKLEIVSPEDKQVFMDEKHQEAADLELKDLFEKSDTICVPIEKLIPGIKSKPVSIESRHVNGKNLPDRFSEDLAPMIYREYRDLQGHKTYSKEEPNFDENVEEYYKKSSELESLRGQVVIDLGCTDVPYQMYIMASLFGAKGFVGVDAYDSPEGFFKNKTKVEATEMMKYDLKRYGCEGLEQCGEFGINPIPGVGVEEDMLSFLRRLPDNSVSIITSGIDQYVLDTFTGDKNDLVQQIEIEIQRVLSDKGVYLSFESIFKPKELIDKMKDASAWSRSSRINIFKKQNKEF